MLNNWEYTWTQAEIQKLSMGAPQEVITLSELYLF